MKKIILFGGTFDPPHNGHISLLQGAIKTVQPDLVLIEPAGTPPHKADAHTPAAHRLAMCACFLPLFANTLLDTTEIERSGKSYTIDTVNALYERYGDARLYLPIGSDMLLYFRNWRGYQDLLRLTTLVVHSRKGEDVAPVGAYAQELCAQGAEILFVSAPIEPVSSTEIRALCAAGRSIAHLVPQSVEEYIRIHDLYKKL